MICVSIFHRLTKSSSLLLLLNIFIICHSLTSGQTPTNKLVKVKEIIPDIEIELKYSTTDNPSLKFYVIRDSIISPTPPFMDFCGLAINPRIPANCLI